MASQLFAKWVLLRRYRIKGIKKAEGFPPSTGLPILPNLHSCGIHIIKLRIYWLWNISMLCNSMYFQVTLMHLINQRCALLTRLAPGARPKSLNLSRLEVAYRGYCFKWESLPSPLVI